MQQLFLNTCMECQKCRIKVDYNVENYYSFYFETFNEATMIEDLVDKNNNSNFEIIYSLTLFWLGFLCTLNGWGGVNLPPCLKSSKKMLRS